MAFIVQFPILPTKPTNNFHMFPNKWPTTASISSATKLLLTNMSLKDEDKTEYSHRVYKNDPVLFQRYVNKKVSVKTTNGKDRIGTVYTVDPVSESVVLIRPNNEDITMEVIMGHAIQSITVVSESESDVPEIILSSAEYISPELISQRKIDIMEVLKKNRFPVTESEGILDIQGIVSIEPPYDTEHCISANEIVLSRIQELVSDIIRKQ